MTLTGPQLATLKNFINADPLFTGVPNSADGHFAAAAILNNQASPDYWVWKKGVSRFDVYNNIGDGGTVWSWTIYKNQPATEQNTWVQMFMGDSTDFGQLNFRVGVGALFTAGASANATHCFAVGRKKATVVQKLFAAQVVSPPANSGNNAANARGHSTNPDVVVVESVTAQDVEQARAT